MADTMIVSPILLGYLSAVADEISSTQQFSRSSRNQRGIALVGSRLEFLTRHFYQDGVPLETVETALLFGSLRRLIRPADSPRFAPIRSLAYFRPVIDELQDNPAPQDYRDYLRLKLRMATQKPPADFVGSANSGPLDSGNSGTSKDSLKG